MVQISED